MALTCRIAADQPRISPARSPEPRPGFPSPQAGTPVRSAPCRPAAFPRLALWSGGKARPGLVSRRSDAARLRGGGGVRAAAPRRRGAFSSGCRILFRLRWRISELCPRFPAPAAPSAVAPHRLALPAPSAPSSRPAGTASPRRLPPQPGGSQYEQHRLRWEAPGTAGPSGMGWGGGRTAAGVAGPCASPAPPLFVPRSALGCGRGAPGCPPLSCPLGWRNRIPCGSAALGCSLLPDLQVAGLTKAKSWPWPVPSRSPGDVGALPGVSSGPGNEVFPPRVGVVPGAPLLKPL